MKSISEKHQKLQADLIEAIELVLSKAGVTKTEKTITNIVKASRKIVKEFNKIEKKAESEMLKNITAQKEQAKKPAIKSKVIAAKSVKVESTKKSPSKIAVVVKETPKPIVKSAASRKK